MVAASATAVAAADSEIRAIFSQSIEANDNRSLAADPIGESYSSVSTIVVDAVARTPTASLIVTGDIAYRAYGGPGENDTQDTLDKGGFARIESTDKLGKYYFSGLWRQQDVSELQLLEDGFATLSGTVTTSAISGGFQRKITPTDTVSWYASGRAVDYSLPGGTPLTSLSTTGIWTHLVNRRIDLVNSWEYQHFSYDNMTDSKVDFGRVFTGIRSRVFNRLSVAGNIGVGFLNARNNGLVDDTPLTSGSSIAWNADFLLTYKIFETTDLSVLAYHTIAPNLLGVFSERTGINLTLSHEINQLTRWSLFTQFVRSSVPEGDSSDLITASATYSVRLTPEWQSQLSYIYRHRQTAVDSAQSNAVIFRITRSATVLP